MFEHFFRNGFVRSGDGLRLNAAVCSGLHRNYAKRRLAVEVNADGGILSLREETCCTTTRLGLLQLQERAKIAIVQPRRPIALCHVKPQGPVNSFALNVTGYIGSHFDERERIVLVLTLTLLLVGFILNARGRR